MKEKFLDSNKYFLQGLLFEPQDFSNKTPLLIYLHGAGERGKNVEHLYRHAIPRLIKEGKEIEAFVLCPQCPAQFVWNNMVKELKQMIDLVIDEYGIANDRISITGSSMGGFGTWEMGMTYSNFFSAIGPVAGGGLSWRAGKLTQTPIKAVHGVCDTAVGLIYSELMVDALQNSGAKAELIRLENYGHNDGIDYAYRNTDLIEWLISQRRTDFSPVKEICEDLF